MEEIFVSLEIAQKLKEISFDEPCIAYYQNNDLHIEEGLCNYNGISQVQFEREPPVSEWYSAPTWEQVFKWFRERGLIGEVQGLFSGTNFFYEIRRIKDNLKERIDIENYYSNYEEVRKKLALKMIKIYKETKNNGNKI